MRAKEITETLAVAQNSFAGTTNDILHNLNVIGLIPRYALKSPDVAYSILEKKVVGTVPGTRYPYLVQKKAVGDTGRPETNIIVIDTAAKAIVAHLLLEKYRYAKIGEVWHVASLAVEPTYRGQDLGKKLEIDVAVNTLGLKLKSGEKQTPGAIALWNKIVHLPNVNTAFIKSTKSGVEIFPLNLRGNKIQNYPQSKNEFLIVWGK